MIKLSKVSKSFDVGGKWAVHQVSLTVQAGETLGILGGSGSGKSTLLKLINALIPLTSGSIELNGRDIQALDPVALRRSMGYVFQGIGLFPHMTVRENIEVLLRLAKVAPARRVVRVNELLSFVNLEPHLYANRLPSELSGGQQQRVGVARALANDPDILLMDEPFGALDPINRDSLQEDFITLKNNLHKTVVFVTHDIFEALRVADRIAIMSKGQLQQVGTREEIIKNPANDYVRNLFAAHTNQLARYEELLT